CAAARVTWSQMRDQRCAAQRDGFSVAQHFVDGVLFPAGLYRLKCRYVLCHDHHLCASALLHQRITFLMIAVCVAAEQYSDIGELESELLDRLLDRGHVSFIRAVQEDVSLRRHDKEGT